MTFKVRIKHLIIMATAMAGGLPVSRIAPLLGISESTLRNKFKESLDGYTFKRKKKIANAPYINGTNVDTSRDEDICKRYKAGETLQAIGDSYDVCRERIRQILKKYNMNRDSGGVSVSAFINSKKRHDDAKEIKRGRIMRNFGCTVAQWQFLRDIDDDYNKTPVGKWTEQKSNAKRRGVAWSLTLWEWWAIWDESGNYKNRGIGMGKYVMARIGDTGGYCIGNVEIIKQIR